MYENIDTYVPHTSRYVSFIIVMFISIENNMQINTNNMYLFTSLVYAVKTVTKLAIKIILPNKKNIFTSNVYQLYF